jgi:hypothetical protein
MSYSKLAIYQEKFNAFLVHMKINVYSTNGLRVRKPHPNLKLLIEVSEVTYKEVFNNILNNPIFNNVHTKINLPKPYTHRRIKLTGANPTDLYDSFLKYYKETNPSLVIGLYYEELNVITLDLSYP